MTFDEKIFIPRVVPEISFLRVRPSWSWGRTVGDVATEMYDALSKKDGVDMVTANVNGIEITMVPEEDE